MTQNSFRQYNAMLGYIFYRTLSWCRLLYLFLYYIFQVPEIWIGHLYNLNREEWGFSSLKFSLQFEIKCSSYLSGTVNSILLHFLGHIRIFDDCLSIRHFCLFWLTSSSKIWKLIYVILWQGSLSEVI